jgi:hypothetical protein
MANETPEVEQWIWEAAKEIWPYVGLGPLQTGDSMRNEIAQIIAKHAPVAEAAPTECNEAAEREKFEKWATKNRFDLLMQDGRYVDSVAQYCWMVWLAKAREVGR